MLRFLPLVFCVFCVVAAVAMGSEHRLAEFLPGSDDPGYDDVLDLTPHAYDASPAPASELDRSLVRGKLDALVAEVEAFAADTGGLPEGLADMLGLHEGDSGAVPVDPWGDAYVFRVLDDGRFEIRSLGPDGEILSDDDLVAAGSID